MSLLLVTLLLACRKETSVGDDERYAYPMALDSPTMRLTSGADTAVLRVQLATSAAQRRLGLMERRHVDEDAGMLFVFDSTQPPDAGFSMYRTHIPLEIAYIDSVGVVRSIREMEPCANRAQLIEGCRSYVPGVPYRYALEVNAGYLARHHFGVGTATLLPAAK